MATIRTSNPRLATTVSAILVCWWALAADFAAGLRGVTRTLWGDYLKDRRARRAFTAANRGDAAFQHPLSDGLADPLDDAIVETVQREIGRPAWLWLTALALVATVAAIEVANGWPAVEQWLGWLAILVRA